MGVEDGEEKKKLAQTMALVLDIEDQINMLNDLKIHRVLGIERSCDGILRPLYAKRNQIADSLPNFWPGLFTTHPVLRQLLSSDDLKIFESLTSLEMDDFEYDKPGYSITFNFGTNPYFENSSLKKTFTFLDDETTEITATPIQWKNPNVSGGVARWSFFSWFSCVEQKKRTEDFEDTIANIIKEKLWPNLLSFLTTNLEVDEAYNKVIKKGEVENNQFDGVVHSFENMLKIQDDIDKINEEAMDSVLEVEKLYNETCKQVYRSRDEVIKTVPDFWNIAFLSHPVLTSFLTVEDEEIFKHFTSLEVEEFKDVNPGFSITLHFEPNAYFENTKLTKTWTFLDKGTEITTTPIKWNKGMVRDAGKQKKQKMRFTSDISFFEWFSLVEPEQMERRTYMDDHHYENVIADIIREDLWPNPLSYVNIEEPDGDKADQIMVRKNGKRSRFDYGPHGYLACR
ncbi:Testis-specific Y-encoded-like protein 1 [Euphorbia peplus]|nr:Testis-specific Y-encoded-like protein 1 [Euphorbia peplus]